MPFNPQTKFQGHMYPHDPRHLLWRSQGCPFPTIPPYRWRVVLPFATGEFSPLVLGVFCDPTGPDEHPQLVWEAELPLFYSVQAVTVLKDARVIGGVEDYAWTLLIETYSGLQIEDQTTYSRNRCNVAVSLPVDTTLFGPANSPGHIAMLSPYQWFAE